MLKLSLLTRREHISCCINALKIIDTSLCRRQIHGRHSKLVPKSIYKYFNAENVSLSIHRLVKGYT